MTTSPIWRVIENACRCHSETCAHWRYYVTDGTERLGGTDYREVAEALADKLNKK